ncbi:MAG: hypothetical protein EXR52_06300 [Dehalococcoidia bacterium]|nr:hypothetical protein [Dehalococcoidia bacterium]
MSPAAGASVSTLTPRLTWTDSASGIFYFKVQLTKDDQFRTSPDTAVAAVYHNLIHGGLSNPVNTWAVPAGAALEPSTKYYWRVRPRVQGDGTPIDWSSHFTFETSGTAATPTPAPTFVGSPTATPAAGTPTSTPAAGTATPTALPPTCNWTGTWSSNAGGNFGFLQTGSTATGVFNGTDSLTITALSGNTIGGTRAATTGWTSFTLTATADCLGYAGSIFTPTGGGLVPIPLPSGVNGTRQSATPPPIPTPAPVTPAPTVTPCNMSGNWTVTFIIPAQAAPIRLALTQASATVTGTLDGTGTLTGTVASTSVSGTWSKGGESGRFSINGIGGCVGFLGQWVTEVPAPGNNALVQVSKTP